MVAVNQLHRLRDSLGPGQVLLHPIELMTYERDASLDRGVPDAVAFPHDIEQLVKLVQWAVQSGVPLIARGAGTGLSGGAVAEHGGVIVGFSRMNKLLELDEAGRTAVVEPGLVNQTLDELVRARGFYFPPDPASGRAATLGGNIAENAGGPHCFKYGVTTNYVTGLKVVLAQGQVMRLGGRALDYPEYDLVGLLTGSEGTLGLIAEAHVRLLRDTPAVRTLMASFDTVEEAGRAVSAVIASGLVPATMEMMDRKIMRIIEDYAHAGLPVDAGAALIIEADGHAASVAPQIEEIAVILRANAARDLRIAGSAEERDRIWYGRKSAAGAMARLAPAYYLVDGTVPRSRLAETLAAVNRLCEEQGLRVGYVFHAGDGNLHPFILIPDPTDNALMARVQQVGRDFMQICVDQGGSITGEHGVGSEKRHFMSLMHAPDELAVMADVKRLFDPRGLLNPGKILPAQGEATEAAIGRAAAPRRTHPVLSPGPFIPRETAEAAGFIREFSAAGRNMRIRGGGTKSGNLAAADVTLSTAGLHGIKVVSRDDLYVTVGAGTRLSELQAELKRDKMWVPLASPWAESTVGGIVATNFNAPLRMRYGALRDLALAATVVLPDGRIIRAGRPVVKNVAGYDLPKLFIGSHGTLGLLADLSLKLAPLPRARAGLVVPVETLAQGLAWGARLLRVCLMASALLLCSGRDAPRVDAPYALIYTAEGTREDVAAELAEARAVLQAAGSRAVAPLEDLAGSDLWAAWFRAGEGHDLARVGVAAKDLGRLMLDRALLPGDTSLLADIANGLLYTRDAAIAAVRRAAVAAGGYAVVLAGDTPDAWGDVPEGIGLMRDLKALWDPGGVCNPGAFIV